MRHRGKATDTARRDVWTTFRGSPTEREQEHGADAAVETATVAAATVEQPSQPQESAFHEQRVEQFREERRYIIRSPIPRYFALLVGVTLTPLGIVGLIPQFTRGDLLFHVLRDSVGMSCIYLVTGVAGIFCGTFRRGHYAHLFTLVLTGLYLVLFSSGNIAFGNYEGTTGGPPDFPWIFENALHAGLMLTGALITGLAALQKGDRATAREFKQRYGIADPRMKTRLGFGSLMRKVFSPMSSLFQKIRGIPQRDARECKVAGAQWCAARGHLRGGAALQACGAGLAQEGSGGCCQGHA